MGNRTYYGKTVRGTLTESTETTYNAANQPVSAVEFDGKHRYDVRYHYDEDGSLIEEERGKNGNLKVEKTYTYWVENRLKAVYDTHDVLMAAAYDGDGNRVFQLNYNLHTDNDWKGNSGNGNGNNKDNKGQGNSGNGNHYGWGNGNSSSAGNGNNGNGSNGNGNNKTGGADPAVTDNNGSAYGNTNNTGGSQNRSGILFPESGKVSSIEQELIDLIRTSGKEKNYELIEYVNDVNRQYAETLMELNENGYLDTAYTYGNERLSADRFEGSSYYYLYEGRGSVSAVTGTDGYFTASYRYNAYGEMTFGKPQYENVYGYNGESYNPNLDGQYLRARYYHVEMVNFFTEDSYLGNIREPLSLNRYNYVYSSYLNYIDPSGHISIVDANRADKASFAELCEKKEFFNNLFDQFGFSSKISKLINKLYEGIIEKYHNRSTANYQFFITLGSIVYSNKAWKLLGNMNSQNVNEKYMKHYGLTDEEVKKLYTHINLQHQGAKDGDSYDYNGKSDFAHFSAVVAVWMYGSSKNTSITGSLITGATNVNFSLRENLTYIGDIFGVGFTFHHPQKINLNSIVQSIEFVGPSMGADDYMADLDGINIAKKMTKNNDFISVFNSYYSGIKYDYINRAREFAKVLGNGDVDIGKEILSNKVSYFKSHNIHNFETNTAERFLENIVHENQEW